MSKLSQNQFYSDPQYIDLLMEKEYIAHRLFKSVQELEETFDKLLNQGELQIKWKRKIKNKKLPVPAGS